MGDRGAMRETFSQQGIAMTWDLAEANPFSNSGGGFNLFLDKIVNAIKTTPASGYGESLMMDATKRLPLKKALVITDPPYYDNISYADIMDFFYVWLRRILQQFYPDLFSTMLIPKMEELVATPYHFNGDKEKAKFAFQNGLAEALRNIKNSQYPDYPIVLFYAFKQMEIDETSDNKVGVGTIASTGWETMLEGVIRERLLISGTWPIRTESSGRQVAQGSNVLASSIAIVCRKQDNLSDTLTRRDFLSLLKHELPISLKQLQKGNIAPVDLAQAAIGPGMAIFSRHKAVLEADGAPMRVRAALALINQSLDEYLAEQEGEYDSDTRWALSWYEQYGFEQGPYGVAETLSTAKNTSVDGLTQAGFLSARAGKVRLLRREELKENWNPQTDKRPTAWEAVQYLIRVLDQDGEQAAGTLLERLGVLGENARDLAYRLYTICERKGWAQDALAYNMLVVAWPRIKDHSGKGPRQERML
jgi:putative DNA methylase